MGLIALFIANELTIQGCDKNRKNRLLLLSRKRKLEMAVWEIRNCWKGEKGDNVSCISNYVPLDMYGIITNTAGDVIVYEKRDGGEKTHILLYDKEIKLLTQLEFYVLYHDMLENKVVD